VRVRSSLADWVVAVDAGGTNTRIALVSGLRGAPTSINIEDIATFRTERDYDAQIKRVADEIISARALASERGGMAAGVGASIGGRMLRDGSGLEIAPNLPTYEGKPFVADLVSRTGLPVRAAHDTVCGLLGERRYGALAGAARCAYLTVSTGLGGAIYLAGPGGASGVHVSIEMGHQILDGATRPCLCGQIGCLETYVGGWQLELRHGAPLQALSDPGVWNLLVEKLAQGLVNLAQLTRVELVAVGGAIALARGSLLDELQAQVDARLRNMTLRIVPAALGERAPLIGAAALLDVEPGAILN
jgi:glucokinase